ncbi:GTPase ObgE [Coprothermobacter platensis]|uniref:GTPase ObgE n=1 Tax=Coprothermobacter platensis TaxID=108819 RepID=UPI000370943F|nr:GTPase ObgE [Coprothermobacter platensis]
MVFIDTAEIVVHGGKGGDGAASFRHEKFIEKGGPDGGDGGKGGSVYLVADSSLLTLYDFKYKKEFIAEDGEPGRSQKQFGKDGSDLFIHIPVGVIVTDLETNTTVDMDKPDMKLLVARGGKGGKGNTHMATPTRRTPHFREMGYEGEVRHLKLELKLIAHVSLVGLPNAGKSSLISVISKAKPDIAPYPFTTKSPVLGIVKKGEKSLVVGDVPGLIEGAHEGKGLGLTFLRHIERSYVIAVVLDAAGIDGNSPEDAYKTVLGELNAYDQSLLKKPRILVLNKADLLNDEQKLSLKEEFSKLESIVIVTSAATGEGTKELVDIMFSLIPQVDEEPQMQEEKTILQLPPLPDDFSVTRQDDYWLVEGRWARYISRYDTSKPWDLQYIQHELKKRRLEEMLRRMGAKEGDTVIIHDKAFEIF